MNEIKNELLEKMEMQKSDFKNCMSTDEVLKIRHLNEGIDICMGIVKEVMSDEEER